MASTSAKAELPGDHTKRAGFAATAALRHDLGWLLLIGMVSLGLRLACALQYLGHPLGRVMWVDEEAYWSWARRVAEGDVVPGRPFFQDPLFAYALALLMRLLGTESLATLRAVLAILGALTPLVVFWAGRIGLGRAEAIVAGLLAAVCGPMVFTDALLEKEGLAAFLAALALGLTALAHRRATRAAVSAVQSESRDVSGRPLICSRQPQPIALAAARGARWSAAAAGTAWGAVALLRANALLIGPLAFLWWLWQSKRIGRLSARPAICYLTGFALAIAPVTLANALVGARHELIITTWQAGPNFYIGNGPGATGVFRAPAFVDANPAHEADDYAAEAVRRAGRPLAPGEVSRFWFAEGLRTWRAWPAASCRLLLRKLRLLFSDCEVADSQSFELSKFVAVPALKWSFVTFGWLFPLAALGLARRERTPFWWFLALSTGVGLGSTAVFFVVGRYRVPWLPGLVLLAAAGIVEMARLAGAGRWRRFGLSVVLLAVPGAWLAWRPPPVDPLERWGHAERMLLVAYLSAGQLDQAIDALDDGCALGASPAAHLSELLAAGPLHEQYAASVAIAIRVAGSSGSPSDYYLRRARWLRQTPEGRQESRLLLETGLKMRPSDARFHRELGAWWLGEVSDPSARERAAGELEQAAHGPRGDASAALLLALLERDPRYLSLTAVQKFPRPWPRLRLARAILADANYRPRRGGF